LVSGVEKTRKPFPEIYELTLNRFDLKAEESLFIDDNLRNVEAARALGIHSIQFHSPEQLAQELKDYIKF
jgi:2-haloacid dehalogenase